MDPRLGKMGRREWSSLSQRACLPEQEPSSHHLPLSCHLPQPRPIPSTPTPNPQNCSWHPGLRFTQDQKPTGLIRSVQRDLMIVLTDETRNPGFPESPESEVSEPAGGTQNGEGRKEKPKWIHAPASPAHPGEFFLFLPPIDPFCLHPGLDTGPAPPLALSLGPCSVLELPQPPVVSLALPAALEALSPPGSLNSPQP